MVIMNEQLTDAKHLSGHAHGGLLSRKWHRFAEFILQLKQLHSHLHKWPWGRYELISSSPTTYEFKSGTHWAITSFIIKEQFQF